VIYDSTADTQAHIENVRWKLTAVAANLWKRGEAHDASKLEAPEKAAYDELTPRLAGLTYGSEEYRACLREMKPAIAHHYAQNSHHPEHWPNGVNDMSLLDVIEMICDWKAAGERHNDGNFAESLRINRERFGLSDQLYMLLVNTARELGWML
jgi:hypothetical protein